MGWIIENLPGEIVIRNNEAKSVTYYPKEGLSVYAVGGIITINGADFSKDASEIDEPSVKGVYEIVSIIHGYLGGGTSESSNGWAGYTDNAYSSGSPFAIAALATSTIPNNGNTIVNTFFPAGLVNLYNVATSRFTPENLGDYYVITLNFKAKSSVVSGQFLVSLDLGGASGEKFIEARICDDTIGVVNTHNVVITMPVNADFLANGGIPKISSLVGITSIFDIEFEIARIHKEG